MSGISDRKNRMHFLGPKITSTKIRETLVNYGKFFASADFNPKMAKIRSNPFLV